MSDKSTEILLPSAFGGIKAQSVDSADLTPGLYSTDWFSVFSLPARPSLIGLDFSCGVLFGCWLSAIGTIVGAAYGALVGGSVVGAVVFLLGTVGMWALKSGSPWERLGVTYRMASIVVGILLFLL